MLEMPQSIDDLPVIQVQINGHDIFLLIDTGFLITAVTESTAKRCGISVKENVLEAGSPLGSSATSQFANIDALNIAGNEFLNKSCMIIPDAALDFHESYPDLPPIYGMIGWEIIRKLKWTIDFRNRRVLIESPKKQSITKNMCCDFFPMIRVKINNKNVVLGLDTGASITHFGKCIRPLFGGLEKTIKTSGGVGATQYEEEGSVIPELRLSVGETEIMLENTFAYDDREYSLSKTFLLPGVLGKDIAKNSLLIIDYENRSLAIER